MAIIHRTTMSPGKLELLTAWLPNQPWYLGGGRVPELAKAGGFRLDDPQGEVGIEFLVMTDGGGAVTYHVPLAYRASALEGAGAWLIGTAEHGVLGPRWIYDGTRDPVLVAQLVALIQGKAEPQAQSVSNTPDPSVKTTPATTGPLAVAGPAVAADGPSSTDLQFTAGGESRQLIVRIHRILRSTKGPAEDPADGLPCVSAPWRLPDGTQVRGILASAHHTPPT